MRDEGISVVIPTYNRAALVPRAIESVRAQSRPVAEIIVADDGSTDGTVEVLRELAVSEPRLRILECRHGGANRARNAGVEQATGKWIAFLDSDDYWSAGKLEAQFAALAASPDAVASFTGLCLHHGQDRQTTLIPKRDPSLLELRCHNVLSSTSSALIRSDALREVGGFDPTLPSCQDWDLYVRLRRLGPFVVVREPLVHIDAGPHARISSHRPSVVEGHRIVFDRVRSDLPPGRERRKVEAFHLLVMAELDRAAGDCRGALAQATAACLHHPSVWAARCMTRAFSGAARQMVKGAPRREKKARGTT